MSQQECPQAVTLRDLRRRGDLRGRGGISGIFESHFARSGVRCAARRRGWLQCRWEVQTGDACLKSRAAGRDARGTWLWLASSQVRNGRPWTPASEVRWLRETSRWVRVKENDAEDSAESRFWLSESETR